MKAPPVMNSKPRRCPRVTSFIGGNTAKPAWSSGLCRQQFDSSIFGHFGMLSVPPGDAHQWLDLTRAPFQVLVCFVAALGTDRSPLDMDRSCRASARCAARDLWTTGA